MQNLIYLVAPIFLVILLGGVLKGILISDEKIWYQINRLTYWILFPALLFNKTSVIDLDSFSVGLFSASMILGYLVAVSVAYVASKMYGMSAASLSSVIQGGGRHNSFIALAVISQFFGEQGEIVGALAVAVMVSFSNILTVIFMTSILSDTGKGKPSIISEILRNPFILAIAAGLTFNYFDWGHLPIFHDFTTYLGKAALPLALICVGAGLQFGNMRKFVAPCLIASMSKMIILPATVFAAAKYFELPPIMSVSAVIFVSVPTSSTAYALAKYMGGDAPLMAAIISLQTLLSVVTIPVIILIVS